MKKSTFQKIILHLFTWILFFGLTGITILYSMGYRFDIQRSQITSTGIISINTTIKNAQVYLNDKLTTNNLPYNFTSLTPGNYEIAIKKSGYKTWRLKVEVLPNKVTHVSKISLIPEKIHFQNTLTNNLQISDFQIINDSKNLILVTTTNQSKSIIETNNNQSKIIAKNISHKPQISPDQNFLLYQKQQEIWLYNINAQTKTMLTRASQNIQHLQWHPNQNNLIFTNNNQLKICDINFNNCYKLTNIDQNSPVSINNQENTATIIKNQKLQHFNLPQ